jgi:GDP-L-fucose synthase
VSLIFVTGGGGFLGQHLIKALQNANHEVIAPSSRECNLKDSNALNRVSAGQVFDAVFHLAAWTQAGDFCLRFPGDQWLINQAINLNLLDWWFRKQPQAKLITIGTSCSYPEDGVLSEDRYLEGSPTKSLFTYAYTKRMLYQGTVALSQQYGLQALTVVPSTLYGPGYHTDGKQLHFIFDLARKIRLGALGKADVVLWGDGNQRRELIHVDDFVKDLLSLFDLNCSGLVNIGAGSDFSIREFASMLSDLVGFDPSLIYYDEKAYVGARSKVLDISKLKGLLESINRIDLNTGLRSIL